MLGKLAKFTLFIELFKGKEAALKQTCEVTDVLGLLVWLLDLTMELAGAPLFWFFRYARL